MFLGLSWITWLIIGCMAAIGLSLLPKFDLSKLVPATKPVEPEGDFIEANRLLLQLKEKCKDYPEVAAAVDAAIKATPSMVVK